MSENCSKQQQSKDDDLTGSSPKEFKNTDGGDDIVEDDDHGELLPLNKAREEPNSISLSDGDASGSFLLPISILASMIILSFAAFLCVEIRSKHSGIHSGLKGSWRTRQRPTFLMLLGVEGTGHHLYDSMYEKSPSFQQVFQAPEIKDPYKEFTSHLNPLFRMGCTGSKPPKDYNIVVEKMKEIDSHLKELGTEVTVPVNGFKHGYGGLFLSYPFGGGECQYLGFPDVDMFYQICKEAGVSCGHVVVFRDAYEVVRSVTMKRHFQEKRAAIKLLLFMLDVIRVQIIDHADRLFGCWDYDTKEGVEDIGILHGWGSDEEFASFFKDIFIEPEPVTEEDRELIIPLEYRVYMETLVGAMRKVSDTCKELLTKNKQEEV